METISYNPETVVIITGIVLSLLFKLFPWLNTWYAAKRTETKSAIMIALLLVVSATIVLLARFGVLITEQPITAQLVVFTLFYAVSSNQFTYMITPEPAAVTRAKAARVE